MKIGIYVPNWVGDAVMALPFISLIRRECPEDRILIIGRTWVTDLFKHHPAVDEIVNLSHFRGPKTTTSVGLRLRKLDLDIFYLLSNSWRCAYLAWVSGADCRIGYRGQWRSFLLTRANNKPSHSLHRSEKYLRLIGSTEIGSVDGIRITPEESWWGQKEMEKLGLKKPIAVFPSSIASSRKVPVEKWIEIMNHSGRQERRILFFGSSPDRSIGEALADQLSNTVSICGHYSLRKSLVLISLCEGAIGTDSGLSHVAAILGLPTVSLFGAGDPTHTAPLGPRTQVIRTGVHCSPCRMNVCHNNDEPLLCLKSLKADEIWEVYSSL
ncbi:MAG: lipopolysaccharide heptosyltransferase II [Fidelibacterota bacterium]